MTQSRGHPQWRLCHPQLLLAAPLLRFALPLLLVEALAKWATKRSASRRRQSMQGQSLFKHLRPLRLSDQHPGHTAESSAPPSDPDHSISRLRRHPSPSWTSARCAWETRRRTAGRLRLPCIAQPRRPTSRRRRRLCRSVMQRSSCSALCMKRLLLPLLRLSDTLVPRHRQLRLWQWTLARTRGFGSAEQPVWRPPARLPA
mmetsp:Transcript_69529/g.151307  ORF Transcript_69529/g.151307 Transcript_69529/m.151307 type:complete len:201 (+) Transcript_69529:2175-2777(+)